MSKQRGSSGFHSAQEIGGADDGVQRERVRTGRVRTADGSRLLLSVLAVGTHNGKAAERVIEHVFQTVSGFPASKLANALTRGLEIASQDLSQQGTEVAAAAVAIRRNRVFFTNVGSNVVFQIAGQEAIRLTQPTDSRIGSKEAIRIQASPEMGLPFQRGDRIVVTSPGLLESSPADGKPFVDPSAIPGHIRKLPPEDAAKHLVSIALGRDVESNVTVTVLGEAKEERPLPVAAFAVAGGIALVVLVVGTLVLFDPPESTTTTDYGFAVLVHGGVLSDTGDGVPELVGNLDAIPAGAALSAQTDATLGMQSTFEGSTDLTRGSVYLEQGAILKLSEIDPRGEDGTSGKTRLGLDEGSILVSRQSGTWEYQVQAVTETAVLIGAGPAAMGVETSGGSLQLDCLIGICRYEPPTGEELLLDGGDRILVGASSGMVNESAIPLDAVGRWNELCSGCLQGNP